MTSQTDLTNKGIISWFARNSVAANLLMWVLIIGGLFSAATINKEIFPKFELNMVQVVVAYPGAAPQEIEEGITIKIEEAVKNIEGIKKIRSSARESSGSVTIEVEDEFDPKDILDEVKLQVDAISTFPDSIEQPQIYQIKPEAEVMWVSVAGDNLTATELKELGKVIRDEITSLPGVSRADLLGAKDYEIAIEVSEDKLREFSLTFDDVAAAVNNSSILLPGGSIRAKDGDIQLRIDGQAYDQYDFERIVLRTRPDGSRLMLADVANINDGFEERLGYTRFDGQKSVVVEVLSVGNEDALAIANIVKKYVANKQENLGADVVVDYWGDLSQFLSGRLNMMLENMAMGALLVFIVLAIFLQLKVAFWVMLGLPIAFLGAMLAMPMEPFSLSINMITLFGFILVLGIVVDDAIVIGESAYAQTEKDGHSMEAVIKGTHKVAMPATFGVLTTIAAFIPMLVITGFLGVVGKAIGLVVILCLAFSLVESKLILPAHLGHMKPTQPGTGFGPWLRFKKWFDAALKSLIYNRYKPAMAVMMNRRYSVLTFFLGLIVICATLLGTGHVRTIIFPDIPSDFVRVQLEMEQGMSEQSTLKVVQQLEDSLFETNERIKSEIGEEILRHSFVFLGSRTNASMVIELVKGEERSIDAVTIASDWREHMPELVGVKTLDVIASTNDSGSDVAFRLNGNDLDQLVAAAAELKQHLGTYDGLFDIQDTFSSGAQEVRLAIRPEAEALGLTLSDLARQVRWGFFGYEAQRILRNKEEIKVMVRYPEDQRRTIGHLENMRIRTPSGNEVPFSSVAEIELAKSYATINRTDGVRSITVQARADKARIEPSKVTKEVNQDYIPKLRERYNGMTTALDGSAEEDAKNTLLVIEGAFFALFTIFALMAIPLRSYSQPLIIMSVIPFGMIGAVFGHVILGLDISMLSVFGIIALAGVVVNDSLIMVDFVNQARAQGLALKEAVQQAGTERFRAIILTSLTTFLGLVPITMETSLQAQIVIPMAVSLAFGILFSTTVTLILVPALYIILDDVKRLFRWWWRPGGVAHPLRRSHEQS
ncbi:efflux RND transporter permease subunit [Ferrimonas lipolytica]|uniref:Efflux RND transporter permease subunit n=1 Tax=Ferrimonas lipolytica TaxID=2724191 RepID=A0A6H1UEI1_9GAMM|nr:efflux RND transporter permease subunit [Ferrimonas lipolytica]QIZ77454.1 efflux RND transporter permease subunit [Ferrimonas lipolytica]